MPNFLCFRVACEQERDRANTWNIGAYSLRHFSHCSTLSYMATLTIRLDDEFDSDLRQYLARTGRSKSEFARDALKRQLAISRFKDIRSRVAPFAEAQGWLTDEDVFKDVS